MSTNTGVEGREEQARYYTVSSRKWLAEGSDVHVKEFTLAEGEEVPWHSHTQVFDIFYCIEGRLTIERVDVFSGARHDTLELAVGDSAKVEVGTAHRPFNPGPGRCRFVLIQGVGSYDFLPFKAA
ncbi:MAG TPA: cupin domain-containing protein [Burkholderiales bacterium]|jgi:mannose-6-phosphate isomerase-like protein (cupin superfamily)|nr:cupin domain-containing protein [Burkholderiales bacterium]